MKQTAVEWLFEQIDNKDMGEIPMWIYNFCKQAKELEKQQIIDAYWGSSNFDSEKKEGEQYYNENYKK